MSKITTIPYITGFTVKPLSISGLGVVTFTDGTNDVTPNQLQCEAYGYTYNSATGTCSAYTFSENLGRGLINENNFIKKFVKNPLLRLTTQSILGL